MAAYVIARVHVTDQERFSEYIRSNPRTVAQYGGRYIARGGETILLEGEIEGEQPRVVIIEFPSLEKAREWYHSDEYREVKELRAGAATGSLIAIDGC